MVILSMSIYIRGIDEIGRSVDYDGASKEFAFSHLESYCHATRLSHAFVALTYNDGQAAIDYAIFHARSLWKSTHRYPSACTCNSQETPTKLAHVSRWSCPSRIIPNSCPGIEPKDVHDALTAP